MSGCIWQRIYMGERVNPLVIFLTIDHLPDKELNFGIFNGHSMKKAILFIAIFTVIAIFKAVANDSCVIYLDKQVIFKGIVDREEAVATIKATEAKGTDSIKIVYYSESSNKGWRRT